MAARVTLPGTAVSQNEPCDAWLPTNDRGRDRLKIVYAAAAGGALLTDQRHLRHFKRFIGA